MKRLMAWWWRARRETITLGGYRWFEDDDVAAHRVVMERAIAGDLRWPVTTIRRGFP